MTLLRIIGALFLMLLGAGIALYGIYGLIDYPSPLENRYSVENSQFVASLVFLLIGAVSGLQGFLYLLRAVQRLGGSNEQPE